MENDAPSPFVRAVEELSFLTRRLDAIGRTVITFTLLHVAIAFFAVVFSLAGDGVGLRAFNSGEVRIFLLALDLVTLLACIMSLAKFERLARRGELFFSEIANEKNWSDDDGDRLRFEYRIALREFSLSSELPLARGRAGGSLYVLINGATTLFVWAMVLFVIRLPYSF